MTRPPPYAPEVHARPPRRTVLLAVAALIGALAVLGAAPAPLGPPPLPGRAPAVSHAACANPVACENALPGASPSDWYVADAGDATIQGFGTAMSVNRGDTIDFKIKSATANYRIDIYRLGYYGGDGARLIQSDVSH